MATDSYAALRLRDFRNYLAGNVLAVTGQQMQTVAIGWELYERTNSKLALGLVGLVQVIPIIVLSLPAGHLVDRLDRRRMLMVAQLGMALSSLGLAAVSWEQAPVPLVYLCLFVAGTARSLQNAAKGALLPQIVPREILARAVTWNSGGWQLASVIGPGLGGLMIGTLHEAAPVYVTDAVAALLFLALLWTIPPRPYEPGPQTRTREAMAAALRFVWRSKLVLATITLDLFAVLLGGATALLPVFAKDILHVGPGGLGWLLAAQSIGAVTMAVAIAHRPPMRRAGRALLWAVGGFGVAMIVFGLSRSFALSFGALVVAGALDMISVVVRSTLVPLVTPNALRGRVSAINSIFVGTSNELGGFESGATAAWWGPVASVVAGGVGTMIVVLVIAAVWPELRRLGALQDVVV